MEHIRNINPGEVITDFFVIRWLELRHHDDRAFISMELGCSRGRIKATYWGEDAQHLAETLKEGDVIKAEGRGTEFRGQRWLKIIRLRRAKPDEISIEKLLPGGRFSPAVLWKRFERAISSVKNEDLSRLLRIIFDPGRDFSKKFATYPAAKLWHGAHIGGLIEHTLRVVKICDVASKFYPSCRRDLLIAGALLHDVGKVEEISTHGFYDYSPRGRLLGHIFIGAEITSEAIRDVPKFPKSLADELLHLILSHHGSGDMGSPVEPKTLEAIILHHSDMLDARADGIQHIIERDLPRGDEFSDYIRVLGRYIYLSGYRNEQ